MRLSFLLVISLLILRNGFCQLVDDFSGENLSQWRGDTIAFTINLDEKLQLASSPEAGLATIYSASPVINDASWQFEVEFLFNPSSNNYSDVFLVADRSDPERINGYFVRIGGSNDEISLYKCTDGKITKIIDGQDDRLNLSTFNAVIKVTRDTNGFWELYSDIGNTGNFIKEGETMEKTFQASRFFIIQCVYTSTRSDKFLFDDIVITGEPNRDTISPSVIGLIPINGNTLSVTFSEKIDGAVTNFLETCTYQQPISISFSNDSSLFLEFDRAFPENQTCQLLISGITDPALNALADTTFQFTYVPPPQPALHQLLITEIMADPSPNIELPEAEYLEIYNPTNQTFRVEDLQLVIRGDTIVIPDFTITPNDFKILTNNSQKEPFEIFGATIGLTSWKALLNNGDTLFLVNKKNDLVTRFIYSREWYENPAKENGGYALEMIDTDNPCGGKENWGASIHENGGTPGKQNSIAGQRIDLSKPFITRIIPLHKNSMEVAFSEIILGNSFQLSKLSIEPSISISNFQDLNVLSSSATILLSDSLSTSTAYTLNYKGISDCVGNLSGNNKITFSLPEKADSLDVVFNEIMYDPIPGGAEYIELYNISKKYIDLNQWKIASMEDNKINAITIISNDHYILPPEELIVITENKDVLAGQFPSLLHDKVIETNLFPLTNDGGELAILNPVDQQIDKIIFNNDLHHPLIDQPKGVSLERIEYVQGSTAPIVWQSASSSVNGGTPTLPNSHSLSINSQEILKIEPRVFAPDNDGYRDFTSIHYTMDPPGTLASIYVFDLSGRLVKTLVNQENLPTEGFVIWEGENENGVKVNYGHYIVLMELIAPDGHQQSFKESVAIVSRFK